MFTRKTQQNSSKNKTDTDNKSEQDVILAAVGNYVSLIPIDEIKIH